MTQRDQFSVIEKVREILQSIDSKRKRKPITLIFVKGKKSEERKSACLEIVDCINRKRFDTFKYSGVWEDVSNTTDVAAIDDIDKQNIAISDFFDIVLGPRIRTEEKLVWNKYGYLIMTSEKDFSELYKDATGYHRFLLMDIKVKLIEVDI